jgi:hypothetical protein
VQQPCGTSITRPTKEKTGPYVSRYPWDGSNACCIQRVWQCVATAWERLRSDNTAKSVKKACQSTGPVQGCSA